MLLNEEEELTGMNLPVVIVLVVDTSCARGANYASLTLLHLWVIRTDAYLNTMSSLSSRKLIVSWCCSVSQIKGVAVRNCENLLKYRNHTGFIISSSSHSPSLKYYKTKKINCYDQNRKRKINSTCNDTHLLAALALAMCSIQGILEWSVDGAFNVNKVIIFRRPVKCCVGVLGFQLSYAVYPSSSWCWRLLHTCS